MTNRRKITFTPPDWNNFWKDRVYFDYLNTFLMEDPMSIGFRYGDPALGVLCFITAFQGKREHLAISVEQMVQNLGLSRSTIHRSTKRLVEIGYLEVIPQARACAPFVNRYSVAPLAKLLGMTWAGYVPAQPGVPVFPEPGEPKYRFPWENRKAPKVVQEADGSITFQMPDSGAFGLTGTTLKHHPPKQGPDDVQELLRKLQAGEGVVQSIPYGTPVQQSQVGSEANDGSREAAPEDNSGHPQDLQ